MNGNCHIKISPRQRINTLVVNIGPKTEEKQLIVNGEGLQPEIKHNLNLTLNGEEILLEIRISNKPKINSFINLRNINHHKNGVGTHPEINKKISPFTITNFLNQLNNGAETPQETNRPKFSQIMNGKI